MDELCSDKTDGSRSFGLHSLIVLFVARSRTERSQFDHACEFLPALTAG